MNRFVCLVFSFCMLFSGSVFALRCGRLLVLPSDYKADVYEKCGDPDYVDSHYETRGYEVRADSTINNFQGQRLFPNNSFTYGQSNYAEKQVLVEEWRYDFGSSRLRKLLRFENGWLKEIVDLGRRR